MTIINLCYFHNDQVYYMYNYKCYIHIYLFFKLLLLLLFLLSFPRFTIDRRFVKEESAAACLCHEDNFAWNMHLARYLRRAFSPPRVTSCLYFLSTAFHPPIRTSWRNSIWTHEDMNTLSLHRLSRPSSHLRYTPACYTIILNSWTIFIERI